MHMADALLSPAVGGMMWATTAGAIAYSSAKVRNAFDEKKVPLMGVLGAFLFAAQMVNFTIPGTGSSGHLGGGLLLSILLGPHAALLTIASVLVVQALFFADGGLLALGCNIFNMGIIPALIVYPLAYRKLAGSNPGPARLKAATIIAAMIGLQLGPFAVVLETWLSGISSLPFATFLMLMQPIHLPIGVAEGAITASIVSFLYKARPEILEGAGAPGEGGRSLGTVVLAFLAAAVLIGGTVSWYASKNPDGLEWAIAKVTGKEELQGPRQGVHGILAALQERIAFLPDYSFRTPKPAEGGAATAAPATTGNDPGDPWGTSVSGILGGIITLTIVFLVGFVLKRRSPALMRR